MAEESPAGPKLFPRRAPEVIADVANRVKGEGQKVQGDEDGSEMLVAVTEVMFDMIAPGLGKKFIMPAV
jgi:hypothetical protein